MPETVTIKKGGRPKGSKDNPNSLRQKRKLADAAERLKKAGVLLDADQVLKSQSVSREPGTGRFVRSSVHPGESSMPMALSERPAASSSAVAQPDTDLFGKTPSFERPPEAFPGGQPGPEPSPIPPEEGEPEFQAPPEPETRTISDPAPQVIPPGDEGSKQQRPLATMIWDSIVNMLAVFIGPFWFPRKIGSDLNAGEIPYDEREMVIDAWCDYLHEIGMQILTPGQKLAAAIANYSFPRLFKTIEILKTLYLKKKPKPATAPGDTRFAEAKPVNGEPPPANVS